MDSVTQFLLSIAAIFLIGALGEVIFQRTNIPDVIWLILAGIVLGPVSGLVTGHMGKSIAPYFAAVTLVVVLFEGGTTLKLGELSRAAPRSSALAVLSFLTAVIVLTILTMVAVWIGLLPKSWSWMHGLLVGCILGGSSSIIIMPAMAQARVQARLANLVNLESALTDAFCVVGTAAIVNIMVGGGGGENPGVTLLKSFGIGLGIGLGAGMVWLMFLRLLHSNEHAYPVTLAALLILYVVIDKAGGSAALGILTVAIMLGNAPSLSKVFGLAGHVALDTSVRGFHRQMAFIVKSFFFVFIGAMLAPPWTLIILGVVFAAALYGARIPAVRLATLGAGFGPDHRSMITLSMPRGMAAGVLATLPLSAGIQDTDQLPVVVFAAVFTTILIFAVGFPVVKKKLPPAEDEAPISLPAGAATPSAVPPIPKSAEGSEQWPAPGVTPGAEPSAAQIPPVAPVQGAQQPATTPFEEHAPTLLDLSNAPPTDEQER